MQLAGQPVRIVRIDVAPLSVPLSAPFVIATARIDHTPSVCVTAELHDPATGARAIGLGEAAALPPVTREDAPMLLHRIGAARPALADASFADLNALTTLLDGALADVPVARAGVETAVLDALARLRGVPLATLLSGTDAAALVGTVLETDVTLPIAELDVTVANARAWRARGFRALKVKIGRDAEHDLRVLVAVQAAVPDARMRLDANAGFDAGTAIALLERAQAAGVVVELFEQPCARGDLEGMAAVAARTSVPVVADESVCTIDDLDRVVAARAAHGVNLKLGKHGGPLSALAIGQRARERGLSIMAGAMVETRLGLATMAHVLVALGGADWVDLDTAMLLADDPFTGGYTSDGPGLVVSLSPGHGVRHRDA